MVHYIGRRRFRYPYRRPYYLSTAYTIPLATTAAPASSGDKKDDHHHHKNDYEFYFKILLAIVFAFVIFKIIEK